MRFLNRSESLIIILTFIKMKKSIAIIGSGPSALVLAAFLDENKYDVTIYERNFAPGRKFLVAGDGGFNLTHSEEIEPFIGRYTPSTFLEACIRSFSNIELRNWLKDIGIETYEGTSKRVFPIKGIKPIDVLTAILEVLKKKNVQIKTQHMWRGWNANNELIFSHNKSEQTIKTDIAVFALGGGSWSKTGSDGTWTSAFEEKGIEIVSFQSSNCAYEIKWKNDFLAKTEGKFLKNISITCEEKVKPGELVITKFGIEGGAVYALSPQIRKQLNDKNSATVFIDLKPSLTADEVKSKFSERGNRSITKLLEDKLNFTDIHIELLKTVLTKEEFIDPETLMSRIKKLPLQITAMAKLDEAISTVGGIALNEVNENFQLKKIPQQYAIGEMLDWDAPTGGYLLQGCFSMGNFLGKKLNQ